MHLDQNIQLVTRTNPNPLMGDSEIALFMLRWSKIISAESLACLWWLQCSDPQHRFLCGVFFSALPLPQPVTWAMIFFFFFPKCCCICMRTGLCIAAFRRGFLWGTSLGSKPCSDSCLVNHLNKFSNKVPTSEVKKFPARRREAQHRTPSTRSSRAKFSVNNKRVIVQVALPSPDGRLTACFDQI